MVPKVLKSTCRPHWCLFPCKKSTSSLTSSFEMLYRHCKLAILGTLEMLDHLHQNHSINLSKFSYVPACKKSTLSFTSFLRYCREIANFLFWVFGHVWPRTSKMTVSLLRNVWQLSAGENQLHPLCFPWDIAKIL